MNDSSKEPNCSTHERNQPNSAPPAEIPIKPSIAALKAAKKPPRNEALVRRACLEIIDNPKAPYREKLRAASLLAGLVKLGKTKRPHRRKNRPESVDILTQLRAS